MLSNCAANALSEDLFSQNKTPKYLGVFFWSGCWELNPVYTHPKRAYDRHTPARRHNGLRAFKISQAIFFTLFGIVPLSQKSVLVSNSNMETALLIFGNP